MDKKYFIEAGRIINTHGVRGEIKVEPWADSPEFLTGFDKFYIDGAEYKVLRARVHKRAVIIQLDGINDMDAAESLKNKTLYISRNDAKLPEGKMFVQDLIGFKVFDSASGDELGVVSEIIVLPAQDVMVVKGEKEILVPLVPEFIAERDRGNKIVKVNLIEGM